MIIPLNWKKDLFYGIQIIPENLNEKQLKKLAKKINNFLEEELKKRNGR